MRTFARGAFAGMRAAVATVAAALGAREVMLLSGLGLTGYGAFLIYPPAGYVAPGAVLLYVAIAGLR